MVAPSRRRSCGRIRFCASVRSGCGIATDLAAMADIIRNGRLDLEWGQTERRTMGIASRAISTLIAVSGSTTC